MSHRFRRYSKRELLGSLHLDCIQSVSDLGLAPGANRWKVLRAFSIAERPGQKDWLSDPGASRHAAEQRNCGSPNTR
jgi:hypothetical protein